MSDNAGCIQDSPFDFILRSRDGTDFHVHKEVLKSTSDVFADMFALPMGTCELSRDGIPVVVLPEPHTVLLRVLRLVYSGGSVGQHTLATASDLDGIVAIHEAAHKYHFLEVQRLVNKMLASPALIDAHAHRLFGIARLRGLPDIARAAALATLKSSLRTGAPSFPEMSLLTWVDAHMLDNFHRLCSMKAESIVREELLPSHRHLPMTLQLTGLAVWFEQGVHTFPCGGVALIPPNVYTPTEWFRNHIGRISVHLHLVPSHHQAPFELLQIPPGDRKILDACSACSRRADDHLALWARKLVTLIQESNESLGMFVRSSCRSAC
ncbi:hypothetical protein DFH09DRAFT_906703 [Mycena vulgaris]|nr:hypothetical protein DFH09DRAFT_906703 [Mycena vulgaris]